MKPITTFRIILIALVWMLIYLLVNWDNIKNWKQYHCWRNNNVYITCNWDDELDYLVETYK